MSFYGMALKLYSLAPDFELNSSGSAPFRLSERLKINPIGLFFLPKAFTAGCTREVCSFRDDYSFFASHGVELVGISHDPEDTLERYRSRYHLPFPLYSDPGRRVCRLYDAVYPFGLLTRRVTYYIGRNGLILGALDALLDAREHVEFLTHRITELEGQKNPVQT